MLRKSGTNAFKQKDYEKAIKYLTKFMENSSENDTEIMLYLAESFNNTQNPEKELYWIQKCLDHDKDNAKALYCLGCFYANYPAYEDIEQAIIYLEKASEKGNSDAMVSLGYLYQTKKKDTLQSIFWLKKSVNKGNPNGMAALACILYQNKESRGKYSDLIKDYLEKALKQKSTMIGSFVEQMYNQEMNITNISLSKKYSWILGDLNRAKFASLPYSEIKDMSREELMPYFLDEVQGGYILPINEHELFFNKSISIISDLNSIFTQISKEKLNEFASFYNDNSIGDVISNGYDKGIEILNDISLVAIKIYAEYGRYEITSEHILENNGYTLKNPNGYSNGRSSKYKTPLDAWKKHFDMIKKAYNSIQNRADEEKEYREYQKESRFQVVGGGFGLKGAITGMVQAGAINMITGAAYDIVNSYENKATDQRKTWSENSLHRDPNTSATLIYGLTLAIDMIKMDTLFCIGVNSYTAKTKEKAASMLKNVTNANFDKTHIEKALYEIFNIDPFNIEIYTEFIKNFGDKNNQLQIVAKFFDLEEDVLFAKKACYEELIAQDTHINKRNEILKLKEQHWFGMDIYPEYIYLNEDIRTIENDFKFIKRHQEFVGIPDTPFINHLKCIISAKKYNEDCPKTIPPLKYFDSDIDELVIPEGVERIGAYACANCKNLNKIHFPQSLKEIGTGAFWNCEKLSCYSTGGERFELPPNIEIIHAAAFHECLLGTRDYKRKFITIPDGCKEYALDAISSVVKLPDTIVRLSDVVRYEKKFNLDKSDYLFMPDSSKYVYQYFKKNCLLKQSMTLMDKESAQERIKENKSVSLDNLIGNDSFAGIDDGAFAGTDIISLSNLSWYLVYIGAHAFESSTIESVELSYVEELGDAAFKDCTSLKTFECDSLRKMGKNVFEGCINLKEIELPSTLEYISEDTFKGAEHLVIYCSSKDSYAYKFCKEHNLNVRQSLGIEYYEKGLSAEGKKDLEQAFQFYQKSAEKSYVPAYTKLGLFHLNGYITETKYGAAWGKFGFYRLKENINEANIEMALKWLTLASDNDDTAAMEFLSKYYAQFKDDGYMKLYYLTKAAILGYPLAMNNLAVMYASGQYVTLNNHYAYYWFKKAADNGHKVGIQNLQALCREGKYDPSKAPKLSDKLFAKHLALNNYNLFLLSLSKEFEFYNLHFIGSSDKANKKISNAVNSYAKLKENDRPIACYDTTFFGSADDGFLLSDCGFYVHNKNEEPFFISYTDIKEIDVGCDDVKLIDKNNNTQWINDIRNPKDDEIRAFKNFLTFMKQHLTS